MGSGGSGKLRWKLSFHHRSSAPSSPSSAPSPPSPPPPPPPPAEFTCPISGSLMSDPVILPSGHTFERACVLACRDLSFAPLDVSIGDISPLPHLIPNVNLKSAIVRYCVRSALPHPAPPSPDAARRLVLRLMPPAPDPNSCKSRSDAPTTPSSSASTSCSSSSISSSDLIAAAAASSAETLTPTPDSPAADSFEDEIISRLKSPGDQEAALAALRSATRESRERRAALCTPRLLAALRPFVLSRHAALQSHATAALVNLSLEPPNKVRVVRSGAIPPLVDALRCGHAEARDNAAGALFSLALDDENKAAIGVLKAIPPLVQAFSQGGGAGRRARGDAGSALFHLSKISANQSKLARTPGAVRALLGVALEAEAAAGPPPLRRLALMVICNLAGCREGSAVLMDSGAVEGMVALLSQVTAEEEVEYCVTVLYRVSRGSLRFRGLARAAGAEEAVARVAEGVGGEGGKEMARRTLRAMRGEEDDEYFAVDDGGGGRSVVSDGVVSFRRSGCGIASIHHHQRCCDRIPLGLLAFVLLHILMRSEGACIYRDLAS